MKLNLGCGPHTMKGWVNIDLESHPGLEFERWDLRHGLPPEIKPDSVDYIFSEHFIEHITKYDAFILLRACIRVLKPGGVIRISTPDLYKLLTDYKTWFDNRNRSRPHLPDVWSPITPCAMVNEGMRWWGHQYLYDYPELFKLMRDVGFHSMERRRHCNSAHVDLLDLEVRPYHGELIMEGTK